MRLLPFEFDIMYTPRSRMRLTNYLSRSPHETLPTSEEDEGQLGIAILRELNVQKNTQILKQQLEHARKRTPKTRQTGAKDLSLNLVLK